jgi:hypothetical protein
MSSLQYTTITKRVGDKVKEEFYKIERNFPFLIISKKYNDANQSCSSIKELFIRFPNPLSAPSSSSLKEILDSTNINEKSNSSVEEYDSFDHIKSIKFDFSSNEESSDTHLYTFMDSDLDILKEKLINLVYNICLTPQPLKRSNLENKSPPSIKRQRKQISTINSQNIPPELSSSLVFDNC